MKARAQRLRRLSDLKKKAYYGRFVGRELRVLVQGRDDDGQWRGLSRAYIPVSFSGGEWEVNREVSVMVTAVERDRVRGRAVIP
jgi:threonylcarbamoyladenosine tRNA methylthiotransferase MtaB